MTKRISRDGFDEERSMGKNSSAEFQLIEITLDVEMESVKEPGESLLASSSSSRLLQPASQPASLGRVICLLVSRGNLIMWNNNNF
jgi:hypothetical protein